MIRKSEYQVIGIMSGTSLDGIDIAHCHFRHARNQWNVEIACAETVAYPEAFRDRLRKAISFSALELMRLDVQLGIDIGNAVRDFCDRHGLIPDLIASHGHTIFHDPANGLTTQIGSPAHIAVLAGMPCVADFRAVDVALGGQGAPLVPYGEKELFPDHTIFLNIGGIANVSHHTPNGVHAWDICPANMLLNDLATREGQAYDEHGSLASQGHVQEDLLSKLEALDYYALPAPKSLGREWYESEVAPLLTGANTRDLLATACEHVAMRIAHDLHNTTESVVVTGGGAMNNYLIARIRTHTRGEIIVPDGLTVAFKEAMIFAFLGLKRYLNEINTLSSVTGARRDSCGGSIFRP